MATFKLFPFLVTVFMLQLVQSIFALTYKDVAFVILTQPHPYHTSLADRLKKEIITQAIEHQQIKPSVWITHGHGSWLILPMLSKVIKKHNSTSTNWVVFCDQHITLKLPNLLDDLSRFDSNENIWIGHKLKDLSPTIIHHFAHSNENDDFIYPNFASGFAMSMTLIKSLNDRFKEHKTKSDNDFSIDAAFELAEFVWNDGIGVALTHSERFCVVSGKHCATYPNSHDTCGNPISRDAIFFSIKTYHKFHSDRVNVVKNTWGRFVKHIMFFSDLNDTSIPSINLGIENTDKGHCGKTIAILKHLSDMYKDNSIIKFVVVADDDTILSVSRMCEVLSCYGEKNIILGERYGFNMLAGNGYDYITGGGGIVLSLDVVHKLAGCDCPSPSSPDDMWIGVCSAKLRIPVIHSSLFHQARPLDYALEYLAPHRPVSFHKHWMIDPVDVYRQWFENDDKKYIARTETGKITHGEL